MPKQYKNSLFAKKPYTAKRKTTASQRGASRGAIYGAAAGQLYKDVSILKNMINVEYKVMEAGPALASIGTTPSVQLCNGTARGDDYSQRNGRSVKWASIFHRMTVQSNPASTSPHALRFILFWYKDPSGVAPTPLQMFGSATPSINQMMNLNVRKDFEILEDKIVTLNPVTGGPSFKYNNKYIKCNKHTIYNAGSTGLIGDIESNALYYFVFSDTAVLAEQPYFQIQVRSRFIDN
jgi:hypothetical protein